MIYIINKKPYLALMSYYKEVEISKKGNEYVVNIKKDSQRIERKNSDNYESMTVEQAYKKIKGTTSLDN